MLKLLCIIGLLLATSSQQETDNRSDDIIILHTNDVHCGIQDTIGYDGLKLYKKQLQKKYKNVLVVDSGDHIQGGTIGLINKGEHIIDTMNEVGFDAVTVGNHEFDYGVDRLFELNKNLSCGYISSNIYFRKNKTALFPSYTILPLNGTDKKIAFVGVATPQTLTKTSLISVVDDDGSPTYDFLTKDNGQELYTQVQKDIDAARAEGADYVIILAHLGKGGDAIHEYTSGGLMENLENVDALLDGHSHEIYSNLTKDKNNKEVILAQTGTKLATLGVLTIHTNGTLTHELLDSVPLIDDTLNETEYFKVTRSGIETYVDSDMAAFISAKLSLLSEILGEVIGYTPFELNIYEDPTDKNSLEVNRLNESALCNLVADSYRAAGKSDVTLLNAGAVRTDLNAGNITAQEIIDISPFSNDLEVLVVTGQDILDALEFGVKELPNPTPRFPQVSGMSYKVDKSINTSVVLDEYENFVSVGGKRRVYDVKVGDEPLDPKKNYTLTASNFITHGGDGYSMFAKYEAINNAIGIDNEVFLEYIQKDLNGVIPDKYRTTEGRIIIGDGTSSSEEIETTEVAETTEETKKNEESKDTIESESPVESVGLLGFGRLIKNTNENAKQQIMFKNYDIFNELKKFIRFTVIIIYRTSNLRRLAEKTVNATGTRDKHDNGVDIYNVTYEGTSDLNIESYKSNGDYCFYDEGSEAQSETRTVVGNADMNVDYDLKYHFMERDGQNNFFVNNTDSFDLNVVLNDNDVLEDNSNITFNCLNGTDLTEISTECSLTNVNGKRYKINCKPTEVLYTTINRVNLIYNVTSRRNIRVLADTKEQHLYTLNNGTNGNETLVFIPNNTNSTTPIDNTEDTTVHKFKTNRTSNNGLNGGAITAIVLACFAALIGLVAAIYCLNRPKANTIDTTNQEISSSQNQMKI